MATVIYAHAITEEGQTISIRGDDLESVVLAMKALRDRNPDWEYSDFLREETRMVHTVTKWENLPPIA